MSRACGVLENSTSTGKVRPGMRKTGTEPKKSANLSASSVAEVTIRRKSRRRATTCKDAQPEHLHLTPTGCCSPVQNLVGVCVPGACLIDDAKHCSCSFWHVRDKRALVHLVHDDGAVLEPNPKPQPE